MTTSRSTVAIGVLLALLLAGCGGSAASSAPADAGGGGGGAATSDAGGGAGATPGTAGGGATAEPASGGGGGGSEDSAKVGDQLKPPNATETSKTTTGTYWYAVYHSTDSPDSLKGYYEGQIPKTGLMVVSTTSANGGYVWTIARDAAGSFGGAVTVGPSGEGSGSDVIVAVGS